MQLNWVEVEKSTFSILQYFSIEMIYKFITLLVTLLPVLFAGSLGKNAKVRLAGPLHCLDGSDGEIFVLNLISRLAARSGL